MCVCVRANLCVYIMSLDRVSRNLMPSVKCETKEDVAALNIYLVLGLMVITNEQLQ
jgi:hypothetical protein